ncbi:uncharacterized protein LOC112590401 [Harpegnathos saltator]|uniref:uncharacterized protein LOC112590401 n=1 Tax=Harpegnathos saltator TaxID=610380 RepID=UPI000DBED881|nr:uncharacterized protein LOC112590401 [Harpegnathos saltator]XP_025162535.1 uncharacterized protein LOC112590401 [Harpegnathos saltator]
MQSGYPRLLRVPRYLCVVNGDNGDGDGVALSRREIRCDVIYRDTDGLILCVSTLGVSSLEGANDVSNLNKGPKFHAMDADQQREYEALIVRLINRTFRRYNCPLIAIDLKDSGVETCSIMGKKKYWKTLELARGRFVTKGFEKNVQEFVKRTVNTLQRNVASILATRPEVARCRLVIEDQVAFFVAMFASLNRYYASHGVEAFAFNLALNPCSVVRSEASLIQATMERYGYSPGDCVRCVFALDVEDPNAIKFCLVRDFRSDRDRLNYYKIVRRLAVYFVQSVEGFKRGSIDDPLTKRTYTTAVEFDRTLQRAYATWLKRAANNDRGATDSLFDDSSSTRSIAATWTRWLERNAASVRLTVVP